MRGRVRVAVVMVLALISLPMSLWGAWDNTGYLEAPFGLDLYSGLVVTAVYPGSSALAAGVRVGDIIDRKSLTFEGRALLLSDREPRAGDRVSFRIVHDRTTRDVTLVARPPVPLPPALLFSGWVANYVAILFVSIGALLVLLQPGLMTWGLYLFCLGVRPEMAYGQADAPLWLNHVEAWLFHVLYSLGCAGIIVFVARFPDNRAPGWSRIIQWIALPVFVAQFVQGALQELLYVADLPGADWILPVNVAAVTATFTLVFVTFLTKLMYAKEAQRPSLRLMTAAFGFGGVAEHCVAIAMQYFPLPLPLWFYIFSETAPIVIPVCAAYAIVRYHTLNLGFVANRIVFFGLLAAVAAALAWSLDVLISDRLANTRVEIGTYLALALAAGSFMQAFRGRAVRAIDRVFFRQRYSAAVTLDRIRATTALQGNFDPKHAAVDVAQGLNLASVALFRRTADGGFVREAAVGWPNGTSWHLLPTDQLARSINGSERQIRVSSDISGDVALPAASARPTIAVPLKRRGRVEGAVLIGSRANGTFLDRDEARNIAELFAHVAPA